MQQQPASNIKALSILHFSLLIGQIVFAAIGYYLVYSKSMGSINLGENAKFVVIGVAAIGLIMVTLSFSMYKKKLAALKDSTQPANEKLLAYRAASIIRWAMLEAPVLIAIVGFMLTGNYNLLVVTGVILLLFISTKPTASKAAAELSISESYLNT
ncbi:MAG: hypothetical protein H7Y86_14455 [Rhizobacter sp.]|nr:hypothetical protein [Ferruginibacter sp.]